MRSIDWYNYIEGQMKNEEWRMENGEWIMDNEELTNY
jgi:hypothetical protein